VSALHETTGFDERAARRARLRVWGERLLPWVSLAVSMVGVALMDHSEDKGAIIAIAAAVSWLAFVIVAIVHRPRARVDRTTGQFHKVLRFATTFANQSLIHYSLLFSAPFYLEACAWTPLQCLFAALFAVAVVVASWDPWCARVLLNPMLGSVLLAFGSFVGWNAALPMLGVPHRTSIWLSSAAVAVGIPIVNVISGVVGSRRAWSLVIGLATPLLLVIGGVQAIPPAPLRVVEAHIGTAILEREAQGVQTQFASAPAELVCWTAIRAPRGLKDDLLHIWSRDGVLVRAIELDVRGGRKAGFRTWSRFKPGKGARGRYRCDVITTLGQSLGGTSVTIGSSPIESRAETR
jgi:hypothetical protein